MARIRFLVLQIFRRPSKSFIYFLFLSVALSLLFAAVHFYKVFVFDGHTGAIQPEQLLDSYDFVVVGGGAAGCVVAARLASLQRGTVLLLEAGPSEYSPVGVHRCQWTVGNDGRRASAVKHYLRPAMKLYADRLHVLTGALVTKINIDQTIMRANGVTLFHESKGTYFTVHANKEVIISSGAVESPKLLMLSGLGNEKDLEKLNASFTFQTPCPHIQFEVIKNMPMVGENLMDHLLMVLNYDVNKETGQAFHATMTKYTLSLMYSLGEFILAGTGVLTQPPISTLGFTTTGFLPKNYDRDIQFYGFVGDIIGGAEYLHLSNIKPECLGLAPEWAAYWEKAIRGRAITIYHPSGTCSMGQDTTDSVVDLNLRVHGVQGLRIVDASVFPDTIGANLYLPVVALAEAAAHLIQADYI